MAQTTCFQIGLVTMRVRMMGDIILEHIPQNPQKWARISNCMRKCRSLKITISPKLQIGSSWKLKTKLRLTITLRGWSTWYYNKLLINLLLQFLQGQTIFTRLVVKSLPKQHGPIGWHWALSHTPSYIARPQIQCRYTVWCAFIRFNVSINHYECVVLYTAIQ